MVISYITSPSLTLLHSIYICIYFYIYSCEDTDIAASIFNQWVINNPGQTQQCVDMTAKLTCIHQYFPCKNETSYAPFICSDVYNNHVAVCGHAVANSFYNLPQLRYYCHIYTYYCHIYIYGANIMAVLYSN